MSGDLVVRGGGSTAVASEELVEHATALTAIAVELAGCAVAIDGIDAAIAMRELVSVDAPISAVTAEREIDAARIALRLAAERSEELAGLLRIAASAYSAAEGAASAALGALTAHLGWAVGRFSAVLGLLAVPVVVGGAGLAVGLGAAVAIARRVDPLRTRVALIAARDWAASQRRLLSDPMLVSLTRSAVMAADDAGIGAIGLPRSVASVLGDEGLGVLGLDTSAAVLAGAAGAAGLLRETRVSVAPVRIAATSPALGLADRAARVPETGEQIRVDRVVAPDGAERFELYLGGTLDFSARPSDEPWDLTSNVSALAGAPPAGSYVAVQDALRQAGVTEATPLSVVGYSQGGLLGARLAASGDYDVRTLTTLGAPAAQVSVPDSVPWLAVEHTDDLVPAVGGTWASSEPVVVRRHAITGDAAESEWVFPAHQLSEYQATSLLVDRASDDRVIERLQALDAAAIPGERVESTWYRATREPAG